MSEDSTNPIIPGSNEAESPTSEPQEVVPKTGSLLAEKYGYVETDILKSLREEAISAFNSDDKQKYLDLITMYNDLAADYVTQAEGRGYIYAQLGLMLSMASVRRDTGRMEDYLEDLKDALIFCRGNGWEDAAINVELVITHAEQELAARGQT